MERNRYWLLPCLVLVMALTGSVRAEPNQVDATDSNHDFSCENFLVPCDPNEAGYRKSRNFLRQWYLHGPFIMADEVRAAAQAGQWERVLDAEAVADEANMRPNVQAITDPREMVTKGVWMRWETWETIVCESGWR